MILVLTYHKVVRESEEKPEFYTVTAAQFEWQLKTLAEMGFFSLPPDELLNAKPIPEHRFLLCFDDATVDHYEVVLPLLARHDCRAIFFVPTAKLNRAGYVNESQLREISRAGHKIGLHSHEHRRMDLLCEEDIRVQLEMSRERIQKATGAATPFFAPPGGYTNKRVHSIALESGVRVIRTMHWGYNRRLDSTALECIPLNRYLTEKEFRRLASFRSATWLYNSKQIIKRLMPTRIYEPLRTRLFKALGRN